MADGYAFEEPFNSRFIMGFPAPANVGESAMIVVQFYGTTKTASTAQLVFDRYGDRFHLRENSQEINR